MFSLLQPKPQPTNRQSATSTPRATSHDNTLLLLHLRRRDPHLRKRLRTLRRRPRQRRLLLLLRQRLLLLWRTPWTTQRRCPGRTGRPRRRARRVPPRVLRLRRWAAARTRPTLLVMWRRGAALFCCWGGYGRGEGLAPCGPGPGPYEPDGRRPFASAYSRTGGSAAFWPMLGGEFDSGAPRPYPDGPAPAPAPAPLAMVPGIAEPEA